MEGENIAALKDAEADFLLMLTWAADLQAEISVCTDVARNPKRKMTLQRAAVLKHIHHILLIYDCTIHNYSLAMIATELGHIPAPLTEACSTETWTLPESVRVST